MRGMGHQAELELTPIFGGDHFIGMDVGGEPEFSVVLAIGFEGLERQVSAFASDIGDIFPKTLHDHGLRKWLEGCVGGWRDAWVAG